MTPFFAEQQGPEELVVPLSSGDDGEFWQEIVNLRLRQKGIYTRWEPRGGTRVLSEALGGFNQGDIRTLEAFRAVYDGQTHRFLIIHTSQGGCWYYDLDTEQIKTIVDGAGGLDDPFGTHPLYIAQSGKLVYLFDPDTQRNRVYDIADEQVYDWMGSGPGAITSAQMQVADPQKTFPEQNVFGLKKGAGIIAIPAKVELSPAASGEYITQFRNDVYNGTNGAFWLHFQYDELRETLILSNSTEINATGYYYIPAGVGFMATSKKSTSTAVPPGEAARAKLVQIKPKSAVFPSNLPGDNVDELFAIRQGVISAQVDVERLGLDPDYISYNIDTEPDPPNPEEYVIGGFFTSDGSFQIIQRLGGVWDYLEKIRLPNIEIRLFGAEWRPFDYFNFGDASETLNTIVVPDRADLRDLLDHTSMLESQPGGEFETKDTFEMPVLQRAYALIDVLGDGSYTLPGPPLVVKVPADKIIQESWFSVKLDIPAAADNVSARHLIATRWHLDEESLFTPSSERYPNGAWFLHSEIDAKADDGFLDTKADAELITELSELLALSSGVATQFASGEIQPVTAVQYKNSLFLGGYDIARQAPQIGKNILIDTGNTSPDPTTDLHVYFEYTNGDTSELVNIGPGRLAPYATRPSMRFYNLNALIKNVSVLVEHAGAHYRVAEFDAQSPLFSGAPIDLPLDGDVSGYTQSTPSLSPNYNVSLRDHLLIAIPFQQAQIDQQVALSRPAMIRAVVPLSFDQDKTLMRFRALIQTDRDLQVGFITEQASADRSVVQGEFETIFVGMGTESGYGARRIGNNVFVSGDRGLYAIPVSLDGQIGQRRLVVDRYRYPEAADPLQWSAYNEADEEVWLVFPESNNVFVWSGDQQLRQYTFSQVSGPVCWIDGQLVGSMSHQVIQHEGNPYSPDHDGHVIDCHVTSRHLLSAQHQVRLLTLGVTGRGVQVLPILDLQSARRRPSTQQWDPEFSEDVILGGKVAEMYERLWDLRRQAIVPRMRMHLNFNEGGEVHGVRLRYVPLRNTGKPNQTLNGG